MNLHQKTKRKITLPNVITIFRLIGAPIFFVFLYYEHWATLYLFLILAISDFLDGRIARWQGSTSLWGERWDPVADKILVMPLLLYFWSIQQASFIPVLLICLRELVIIYFRGLASGQNIRTPSMFVGKLKMVFESIALSLFILGATPWANTALWLAMVFAIASLIQYALHWQFVAEFMEKSSLYRFFSKVIRYGE